MAEKSETLVTKEEKLAEAKELFGRGSRNYCMKQYSDAADDLSACCTIYSELYGPTADECGLAYLLYAKSLIALGKDENNLIVPGEGEEEEDGEDDDEGDDEAEDGENGGEEKVPEEGKGDEKEDEKEDDKKDEKEDAKVTIEGESVDAKKDDAEAGCSAGPSTSNGDKQNEENEEEEEEEKCEGNLEVAWEILELAVKIFEGQGESSLDNLSECYAELASISLENGNFVLAINDYNKALAVYDKVGKADRRVIAEINYKIGLCHLMQNDYDESIKAFREACNEMDNVIRQEQAKEQDEKSADAIKNLEETKQEIMEKIAEVEDTKKTSIEEVKRELSKIIVKCDSSTNGFDGAGPSSSSSASTAINASSSSAKGSAKPTDITHLIKRKKPDSATTEVEGSPAKKTAVETDKISD